MSKGRWDKAEFHLRKSLEKEPVSALTKYLLADYFFRPDNPHYNTDSAYHYATSGLQDLTAESERERKSRQRLAVDSASLVRIRQRIDSAVFVEVRKVGTEEAYIAFLEGHPFALERQLAISLRNEVAFKRTRQRNTHEAYFDFLQKYPDAVEAPLARRAYERLIYQSSIADGKLSSYEKFLKDHPTTPYREEVEKAIFELYTLPGRPSDFVRYLETYRLGQYARTASDFLFHLVPTGHPMMQPYLTDSLRHIARLQESYLVPFLQDGSFGMMDKQGQDVIPAQFKSIDEVYLCGNITEDVIVVPEGVLARNGAMVYPGEVSELDDMGSGYLLITESTCRHVVHKSGLVTHRCVDDARLVENRFVAIKRNGLWQLYGLTGRPLDDRQWKDLSTHGPIVLLKDEAGWNAITIDQLSHFAETGNAEFSGPFDEVRPLFNDHLLVTVDDHQGVLDRNLEPLVAIGPHSVSPFFGGYAANADQTITFFLKNGRSAGPFTDHILRDPWLLIRRDSLWHVLDPISGALTTRGYDSIAFEGPFLVTPTGDSVVVHFSPDTRRSFSTGTQLRFIPGKDSTAFLLAVGKQNTLYDVKGGQRFSTALFEDIQHAGGNLFIVTRKGKKGLLNIDGKVVLRAEFDAIGTVRDNVVSLLRDRQFGLYNPKTEELIRPSYEKNIRVYSDRLLVAFRDGAYRFINWKGQRVDDLLFDEILPWNDSTAWIKRGSYWALYDLNRRVTTISELRDIRIERDDAEERVVIIRSPAGYGVVSNSRGVVIQPTFTDLVNVGSPDDPMYFTEKHVAEAAVFVVIYYDANGKFLRRAIYADADEYDRIYCRDSD